MVCSASSEISGVLPENSLQNLFFSLFRVSLKVSQEQEDVFLWLFSGRSPENNHVQGKQSIMIRFYNTVNSEFGA
jgi:hypothetical protein